MQELVTELPLLIAVEDSLSNLLKDSTETQHLLSKLQFQLRQILSSYANSIGFSANTSLVREIDASLNALENEIAQLEQRMCVGTYTRLYVAASCANVLHPHK